MQPGDLEPAIRRMFAGDRLESRIATLSQDMAFYRWTMEGRCYRLTMSKLDIVTRTTEPRSLTTAIRVPSGDHEGLMWP